MNTDELTGWRLIVAWVVVIIGMFGLFYVLFLLGKCHYLDYMMYNCSGGYGGCP
jgi:hypothetical protein